MGKQCMLAKQEQIIWITISQIFVLHEPQMEIKSKFSCVIRHPPVTCATVNT